MIFPQSPVNHIACFILLFLPPPSIVDQVSELLVFVLLQPDILGEAKVKGKPLAWQAEPELPSCHVCTVWSWTRYVAFLDFSFHIYIMRTVVLIHVVFVKLIVREMLVPSPSPCSSTGFYFLAYDVSRVISSCSSLGCSGVKRDNACENVLQNWKLLYRYKSSW